MITAVFWTTVLTTTVMIVLFGRIAWCWIRAGIGGRVLLAKFVFYALATVTFCWLLQGLLLAVNREPLGYIMSGAFTLLFVAIAVYFVASVRLVPEYEQLVVMAFGRYWETWGPGMHFGPRWVVKAPERWRVTTQDLIVDVYPDDTSVEVENALVGIKATITVKIVEARNFVFTLNDGGDAILDGQVPKVVRDAIQTVLGGETLKNMRTTFGSALKDKIEPLVKDDFEHWGLEIVSLVLDDLVEPPDVQSARMDRYGLEMLDQAARDIARRALGITEPEDRLTSDQLNQIKDALTDARSEVARLRALAALGKSRLVMGPREAMSLAGFPPPATGGVATAAP